MTFKNLLQGIRKFFNELASENAPFAPSPEVQKKLESKGYRFEFQTVAAAMSGLPVTGCSVFDAQGRYVDRSKETWQAYMNDYEQAVAECTPPAPGPK